MEQGDDGKGIVFRREDIAMKLKWNGMDIELTVDEFQELVTRGIIDDPEDSKVPYPKEWEELLKGIPKMPNVPPVQEPLQPLQPYVQPKPDPFRDNTVLCYGCQPMQSPWTFDQTPQPQWNLTCMTSGTSCGDKVDAMAKADTTDGDKKA